MSNSEIYPLLKNINRNKNKIDFKKYPKMILKLHQNFFKFSKKNKFSSLIILKNCSTKKEPEFEPIKLSISEQLDTLFPSLTSPSTNKYHNRQIFTNKVNVEMFQRQHRYFALSVGFWLSIGTIVYLFVHPLATLIPAWIASGNMLSFMLSHKFAKKLIYRIDIDENVKLANIFMILKKNPLKTNIKNIIIKNIEKADEKKNVYVITLDFDNYYEMKLFVPDKHFEVTNNELIKNILLGNEDAILKMTYEEEIKKVIDIDQTNEKK